MGASGTTQRAAMAAQRAARARRRMVELDERLALLRRRRQAATAEWEMWRDSLRDPAPHVAPGPHVEPAPHLTGLDALAGVPAGSLGLAAAQLAAATGLPSSAQNADTPPGDELSRHVSFDVARRLADLSYEQVWLAYLALDGHLDMIDVEAHLSGLMCWPHAQQDVLAHALNEALEDAGLGRLLPYWSYTNPHAVSARLWGHLRPAHEASAGGGDHG